MSALLFAQNAAIAAEDFSSRFSAGESPIASYALKQFTAVGASATLANGAGTSATELTVDDVTTLTVGNYYQIGSADPVRIDAIVEPTNLAVLAEARTWADNAQVKPVTVGTGSVSGLTLNPSTGVLSGTPDTLGTTASATFPSGTLFVRATDGAGLSVDTSPFDIQIDAPPIPPIFVGFINNESFTVGDVVSRDYGAFFTGASSYSIAGQTPAGLTLNTSTGVLSGTVTTVASYSFTISATNSAGTTSANSGASIVYTVDVVLQCFAAAQSDGFLVDLTPTANGLVHGVALRRRSTQPNATQIAAGTDGDDNPADAMGSVLGTANVATQITFSGLALPKYDLYVADAAGVMSGITDQLKSAPSGRQYAEVDLG